MRIRKKERRTKWTTKPISWWFEWKVVGGCWADRTETRVECKYIVCLERKCTPTKQKAKYIQCVSSRYMLHIRDDTQNHQTRGSRWYNRIWYWGRSVVEGLPWGGLIGQKNFCFWRPRSTFQVVTKGLVTCFEFCLGESSEMLSHHRFECFCIAADTDCIFRLTSNLT